MKFQYLTSTAIAALVTTFGGAATAQNMIDTSEVTVDGADITFSSVMAEEDGYLVIHTTQDGEVVVPESIGSAAVSAGENNDVTVTTEYPLAEDENYVAMLHVESNGNETYDFGPDNTDVDTPVTVDGEVVTASFGGSGSTTEGDAAEANETMPGGDSSEQSASAEMTSGEVDAERIGSGQMAGDMTMADLETHIAQWPQASKKAAMEMWDKYGAPAEMADTLLIWRDNGPFVRTYVYGYEIDHNWPAPHKDVLQQFIHYDVPADVFDELAMFDGSIIAERTKGEISARCHSEFANLIALNLGNDVITGEKSVDEARAAYEEAVRQHMAGNSPEIAQRLTFEPAGEDITNAEEAVIQQ